MLHDDARSSLQRFVVLENRARQLFKDKLGTLQIEDWTARTETAAALWRADKEVKATLEELKIVAKVINNNFLEYTLEDILKLWFFIIGIHENFFFNRDGSHSLFDLINKSSGYSFNSTMSFVCNRFDEMQQGKVVFENLLRIEMSLAYLLIFTSRLLYNPFVKEEERDSLQFRHILGLPMRNLIMTHISLLQVSLEKQGLMTVLEGCRKEIETNTLTKEHWSELVTLALRNFINLISIADYLKNDVYDADWQVLRPSFFELSKQGWTVKCFMCRYYEGPACSPEFPFDSIQPKEFVMYG